jgi:heme oxygenase
MHDAVMRRRIAALVIAALLAMSGATLGSALLAEDAQATVYSGGTVTDW